MKYLQDFLFDCMVQAIEKLGLHVEDEFYYKSKAKL